MKVIEKAIMEAQLGLTPSNDGQMIRLADPAPDRGAPQGVREARPQDGRGRPHRRRNVRRDVLNEVKRREKDGELSQDEPRALQDEVQKLTDAEVKSIDEAMATQGSRDP